LSLHATPLTELHRAAGARMVDFAGYEMPVQYPLGVLKEHLWTREHCGLFDVSHMGPALLELIDPPADPDAAHAEIVGLLAPLLSADLSGLKPGALKYSLLLNASGGIDDDLILGRTTTPGRLYLVVNAGTKDADFAKIAAVCGPRVRLTRRDADGLIAVQGPEAADLVTRLWPEAASLSFMTFAEVGDAVIARSGYTGEDGFEILVPAGRAAALWNELAADPSAQPIGLGARDSLRLEAGLPLYGHDLDPTVSPFEAGLGFAVSKKRLRQGAMAGAARLARELNEGPARVRVGLKVSGAPAREGAEVRDASGRSVGRVTSGGFAPSLGAPIALALVDAAAAPGPLSVVVRERVQAAEIAPLPFVPHRYHRSL
jgi:aminomethyltransferase